MKDKTIYWAVLLWEDSKKKLLTECKPMHSNIFAEHMTMVFGPTKEQEEMLQNKIGETATLIITGRKYDDKGDAVVISGIHHRLGGGVPHITVSCANKTKPVYSNKLLENGWDSIDVITLYGTIARRTNKGWDKGK